MEQTPNTESKIFQNLAGYLHWLVTENPEWMQQHATPGTIIGRDDLPKR